MQRVAINKARAGGERRPPRRLLINDPGELTKPQISSPTPSRIQDSASVVNGQVTKADGSFLTAFFIHRLVEYDTQHKIYMGSYPSTEADVDLILNSGCNAVLSLQTDQEMQMRGVDERTVKMLFK